MNRENLPSIDLLKGFEATARHLSFTRASEELHLSQSAVSRQVRQLERDLGVRLFDRRARSVVLTDVGYHYYVEIQRLLLQLVDVTRRARMRRKSRTLRVTTTPTFASLWLIPRLADFQHRHPHVHVHVVAENALRDLGRQDFDVAIRYSQRALAGPDPIKLFDERLVPLCAPAIVQHQPLRRPEDLGRCFLIHFNDIEGYAPWLSWDTWFSGTGIGPLEGKGALYFSHYDQAMRAALAGQGVALGRVPVVDDLLRDGRLVAPFGQKLNVKLKDRSYWLMTSGIHRDKEEVRAFSSWLLINAQESDLRGARLAHPQLPDLQAHLPQKHPPLKVR